MNLKTTTDSLRSASQKLALQNASEKNAALAAVAEALDGSVFSCQQLLVLLPQSSQLGLEVIHFLLISLSMRILLSSIILRKSGASCVEGAGAK